MLLLFCAGSLWAGGKSGTNGAAFLKIPAGARPASMGGAFTAVADDAHAAVWNPAGLAQLEKSEITATHNQWFQSARQEFLAGAFPTGMGTFAASVMTLSVDSIDRRLGDTAEADGSFASMDGAYGLSYGRAWGSRWSAGLGLTYVRQTLDGHSAATPAATFGALWKTPYRPLTLGASVRHLGGDLTFDEEGDPLPLTATLGAAGRFWDNKILLAIDGNWVRNETTHVAAGFEYSQPLFTDATGHLRAGYNTAATDVAGQNGYSLGLGLSLPRWGVDMTYAPYGDLGDTFRYGFHIFF